MGADVVGDAVGLEVVGFCVGSVVGDDVGKPVEFIITLEIIASPRVYCS